VREIASSKFWICRIKLTTTSSLLFLVNESNGENYKVINYALQLNIDLTSDNTINVNRVDSHIYCIIIKGFSYFINYK